MLRQLLQLECCDRQQVCVDGREGMCVFPLLFKPNSWFQYMDVLVTAFRAVTVGFYHEVCLYRVSVVGFWCCRCAALMFVVWMYLVVPVHSFPTLVVFLLLFFLNLPS